MPTPLKLVAGTLATNCWPASPQLLYNEMFERGSALLGDITGIIISDSAPEPNDRDKAWIKTSAGKPVLPYPFVYQGGAWIAPHPAPPSAQERRLWVGSTGDLITYDGGASGGVGDTTGPIWEIDTDFTDRLLIGAGTTAAVNVNAGAATNQVTLITANLPVHYHTFGIEQSDLSTTAEPGMVYSDGGVSTIYSSGLSPTAFAKTRTNINGGSSSTVPDAFSILPAVRGIYLIKRTARIFLVAA
jgi:microcystin-dependent protein